jgi:hypothetical protein
MMLPFPYPVTAQQKCRKAQTITLFLLGTRMRFTTVAAQSSMRFSED